MNLGTTKNELKKRDRWGKNQEEVLVAAWAENYSKIKSLKLPEGWQQVVDAVNVVSNEKHRTKTQCKDKIKNLTSVYWVERKESEKTGASPHFIKYFHTFDSVHGCRDVASLPEYKEVGMASTSTKKTSNEECDDELIMEQPSHGIVADGSYDESNDEESDDSKHIPDPCASESNKFISAVKEEQKKEKLLGNANKAKGKKRKANIHEEMFEIQREQLEYSKKADDKN